jgi:subtilisin family serine protease
VQKDNFKDSLHLKKDPVKTCPCGDPNLEFLAWDYDDFPNMDIQSAKNGLTGGPGKAQGDQPFTFFLPLLEDDSAYRLTNITEAGKYKAEIGALKKSLLDLDVSDTKINIVVIDTGIDFYKNRDMDPFLYSTQNLSDECGEQISGWNFVGNTKEVDDDQGHGTYVTRLITSELDEADVQYRILPVKAFNSKGEGEYWNIVCALSYVKKIQEANKNLHVMNTSFGYSFFKSDISEPDRNNYAENSIVKELIDDLKRVSVIASAGNIGNDTNLPENENYPASFTSENIIGVGGYIQENQDKKLAGNFGNISIDVAAPFSGYRYNFQNEINFNIENVKLIGSSYSAAYTSAKMAELINNLQLPASTNQNNMDFLNPINNWVKIDSSLKFGISQGRYQEK